MKDPLEETGVEVSRGARASMLLVLLGLVALLVARPSTRYSVAIVAGIIVMVILHEAGHYVVAKRAGIKVTEFFVGFGPRLWSFRRGETEYGVKAILVGGYVRTVGMTNLEEVDPADEARTFRRAGYGPRLLLTVAGVSVNILLAFLLFFIVIAGQGRLATGPNTTVDTVQVRSAADTAGLRGGDRIVGVEGHAINSWNDLKTAIESRPDLPTTIQVVRGGQTVTLTATLTKQAGKGFLGVSPGEAYRPVGLLGAIPESFKQIADLTTGTAGAVAHLVSPSGVAQYSQNFTSKAPAASSAAAQDRPVSIIGIVTEGSQLVNGNVWALLWLLGSISLLLALFNLLPVLPFDGGHAVVVCYEWVASKVQHRTVRVDFRKLMPVTAVVLMLLVTLSLSAAFLDVRQAFGG
ncbi:MAG TPA: site-2 protease family protein [Acidimicrobiia bacterium]|nr:site-2 protease family protein [Acidimicrobiia bacterium]HWW43650.1 site-2 protease family protein [Acidimicrobiia bacterium]